MSGWGTKIFDNDFALDVKTDFVNLIGVGMSIEEIEDFIISKKYPVNTFYSWAFPRCLRRSAQCYKITLG